MKTMAHQRVAGYSVPCKFTYKELDGETGLYYFGAKYYDPVAIIWHGVDPEAAKAPGWIPYRYGFDNPLRMVEPNGRFEIDEKALKDRPNLILFFKGLSERYKGKSDEFKKAFKQYRDLNDEQIQSMLGYGNGPKIELAQLKEFYFKTQSMVDANGITTNKDLKSGKYGDFKIYIDIDLANLCENTN